MTIKDLLARAKFLGVKGRHDMAKADLEVAVAAAEREFAVEAETDQAVDEIMSAEDVLEARAVAVGIDPESLNTRDLETAVNQREMVAEVSQVAKDAAAEVQGKPVRRRGTNLNTPWARKYYHVDVAAYREREADGSLKKAPMQVQLLLRFMVEHGITSVKDAEQGVSVASMAINTGAVKSVIEPQVLFAYYRSKMERLGLVFSGYNLGGESEDADEVDVDDTSHLEDESDEASDEE
jgi:hypothetical protein